MSVEPWGPVQVQARIATIQGRFGRPAGAAPLAGSNPRMVTASADVASTPGAGSFADALAALLPGAAGATGAASRLTAATYRAGSAAPTLDGAAVVHDAQRYLGVPYVWGGTDPANGLDCSGLVQRVYGDLGIDLPRVSEDQARAGRPVPSLAAAQPGDLIAFGSPVDHIGIYAGDGKMIVAPKTGDVVKVQAIYRTPTAIRRVLPDAAPLHAASLRATAPTIQGPTPYLALFTAAGEKYGVAPNLLAAVARAESGFDPRVRSGAGAIGLMQLMPGTARDLGVDPSDPAQAVDGAARLLAEHLQTYHGSVPLALAAYNAGPGAVARYGGIPPYRETQAYIQRVLSYTTGAAA
jgi:cell wall-associated NlpC family hydrolase